MLDLGKYIFEQNKKERLARKSQTKVELKEIRLRPKTNEHHRMFKVRDARRWLEAGMKVKVTIRFRGREVTYPEIALEDLREIAEELRDVSTVEIAPSMEGRSMTLILAPTKGSSKKPEKTADKKPSDQKPAAEKTAAKKPDAEKPETEKPAAAKSTAPKKEAVKTAEKSTESKTSKSAKEKEKSSETKTAKK